MVVTYINNCTSDEVETSFICLQSNAQPCCFPNISPFLIYFSIVYWLIIAVVGTTGNFLTLIAIPHALRSCKHPLSPLRNSTTILLLNLSVADLFYCLLFLPASSLTYLNRGWPFGAGLCFLSASLRHIIGQASPNTIAAMAMNRALALWWPSAYRFLFETFGGIPAVAAIWIISIGINMPILLGVQGTYGYSYKSGQCMTLHVKNSNPNMIVGAYLILPDIITLIGIILVGIKRHRSWAELSSFTGISPTTKEQLQMRENRLALLFALLGTVHFVSDGPLTVAYFCCWNGTWASTFLPASYFATLSFALDFFIYALRISCYRGAYILLFQDVRKWLRRRFSCTS